MDPELEPIGRLTRPTRRPRPQKAGLKLPKGCAFLIDSNEAAGNHLAYELAPAAVVNMPVGDYSVMLPDGRRMLEECVVERKSFENLLGEIAHGRERWERALERLASIRRPHLIIEASWSKMARGDYTHTQVHPNAVLGSVVAWCHRHRVPVWLVGGRSQGQQVTEWILARAATDELSRPS